MRHITKSNFLATSTASEGSLALGSQNWTIYNDSKKCSYGNESYSATLTLHTCNAEKEFACRNAFCIAMEARCDAKEDCSDGSDEQDCGKLMMNLGYMSSLPPPTEDRKDLDFNVSIEIIDILETNELTETFRAKILLTREWFDNRLDFKHLKTDNKATNNLEQKESSNIWYPSLIYSNLEDISKTKNTDNRDTFKVVRSKLFTYTVKNNMHIFKGSENPLVLTKERSIAFICNYNMHTYPFDTQLCRMEFLARTDSVNIKPVDLKYNHDISLGRYRVSNIRLCKSTIKGKDAVVAEVTLKRPIIGSILTVFNPTITLLLISFFARFYTQDYFDLGIMVNLTILLVLATL